MKIPGYEDGSDITLINSFYIKPQKDEFTGNWKDDVLTIVYKDNITGEKKKQEIKSPKYKYYIAKPEYRVKYNRLFIERDKTEEYVCKYKDILKDIASRTGNLKFYYNNAQSGNNAANNSLHTHPDVFMSDIHIEDYSRHEFAEHYTNKIIPVTKSFFDIEADTESIGGEFPEMGQCPINAATIIFKDENKVFTFLLDNKTNPQIKEFMDQVHDGSIFKELVSFIVDAVGGIEKYKVMGMEKYEYNILMYPEEEEIKLIQDIFIAINTYKPDFVLAWNMAFDIPYIIERIRRLGYNPEEIMCHPDFDNKKVYYFIDERVKNEFAERGDYAIISSYSVFMDQMIQFASRRKSQSVFSSFSLDYIGNTVAKVKKLNYKHICDNLVDLPRKSYKTFVFYNIFDTIVQNCIEVKSQDMEYVFTKCNANDTRYSKCHRQTVYLTNRGAKEFRENDNLVMGNNYNKGTTAPTTKYPGAFVADPAKMNNYSKIKIYGIPIPVYENAIDMDYSSLYPSIVREFNEAANTQIGAVIIDVKIHDRENILNDDKWSRGGSFLGDYQSHVWLEFYHRWFNLADYRTLYEDIEYYYTYIRKPNQYILTIDSKGLINPLEDLTISNLMDPLNYNSLVVPISYTNNWDRFKAEGYLNHVSSNQHFRL